jgi:hypothetical protein
VGVEPDVRCCGSYPATHLIENAYTDVTAAHSKATLKTSIDNARTGIDERLALLHYKTRETKMKKAWNLTRPVLAA